MPCNRICDEICYLEPDDIVFLSNKVKSLYMGLKPLWGDPICTLVSELIVITQQISIFFLPSHLCNDLQFNPVFDTEIIHIKNGTFHKKRQRLSIYIVEPPELTNIVLL